MLSSYININNIMLLRSNQTFIPVYFYIRTKAFITVRHEIIYTEGMRIIKKMYWNHTAATTVNSEASECRKLK